MDDFENRGSLLTRDCQLVIQTLQSLLDRRQIGLKVDRFNL